MQISISDEKAREMLTEILIDLIKTRKELFSEIIQEALEEVGLANAEGRKNEFFLKRIYSPCLSDFRN